ncbi:hypothetical protein [Bifidobacterium callitrichidarum]|uniref:Uncharacterized protein n=1 Tax=Bifidobacterium callitrichidarum TaxID=2052941 RepID=A0A2U2N928_9BIFI|nr:hypothetical protein [Bifidobacterium callitrichidarum]PWG65666.1 hypothetical protein DF196_06960 [Bifidobacterium callitrichidarum]
MAGYNEADHPRNRFGEYRKKDESSHPGTIPETTDQEREADFTEYAFTDFSDEWLDNDDPRLNACHETAAAVKEQAEKHPDSTIIMGDHGRVYITSDKYPNLRSELKMDEDPDGMMLTATQQKINKDGDWEDTGWGVSSTPGRLEDEMGANIRTAYDQACNPESRSKDNPVITESTVSEGYLGGTKRVGGKYDPNLTSTEKTKLMREDFKQLKKNGDIPKDWKISVRKSEYSMNWTARIKVTLPEGVPRYYVPTPEQYWKSIAENDRYDNPDKKAIRGLLEANGGSLTDDEWREQANRINQKMKNGEELEGSEWDCRVETPQVRKVRKLCEQVGHQYTYSNNNAMVDYFDTDGYVDVSIVEHGKAY